MSRESRRRRRRARLPHCAVVVIVVLVIIGATVIAHRFGVPAAELAKVLAAATTLAGMAALRNQRVRTA